MTDALPLGSWTRRPLLAFDLETAGPDPKTARIVTFASILVDPDGRIVHQRTGLVDPGVDIPAEAAEVHGVTTERARAEGMRPAQALSSIGFDFAAAILDDTPICAYNAHFDLTIVWEEAARHLPPDEATSLRDLIAGIPVIDSLVLDKHTARYRKGKRTLSVVAGHLGVAPGDWHTAEADAYAAALVAQAIAARHPEIATLELAEIYAKQKVWAKEQSDSLRDHFRKAKKPVAAASVSSAWPYLAAGV